jgi:hypothetical protein
MIDGHDPTPVVPHLAAEFYLWLWWRSELDGGTFDLGEPVGRIEAWVDDRLAFRIPGEKKVTAVLTGDRASEALEARAAVYGGKVLQELRLFIRRDDREFKVTLKGPEVHLTRASLPQQLQEAEDEAIYDRIFLYDELHFIIAGLFRAFAARRTTDAWAREDVPAIRAWVGGVAQG